jgi:hypothetical protein
LALSSFTARSAAFTKARLPSANVTTAVGPGENPPTVSAAATISLPSSPSTAATTAAGTDPHRLRTPSPRSVASSVGPVAMCRGYGPVPLDPLDFATVGVVHRVSVTSGRPTAQAGLSWRSAQCGAPPRAWNH